MVMKLYSAQIFVWIQRLQEGKMLNKTKNLAVQQVLELM